MQRHFARYRGSFTFLATLAYLWLTCLLPWPGFQTVIVPKDLLTLCNVLGSVIHFRSLTVYCNESGFCQLHHSALWPTQARVQTWVLLLCPKRLLLKHRVSFLSYPQDLTNYQIPFFNPLTASESCTLSSPLSPSPDPLSAACQRLQ